MNQSNFNPAVLDHNRPTLKKLIWAIEASQNEFKLVIVRCNYSKLQTLLLEQLEAEYLNLHQFHLEPTHTALYTLLRQQLGNNQPQGVCILGLEKVHDLDHLLASLNQVREELRQNMHFPIIVWVTDQGLLHLKQHATDLESWATKLRFNLPPEVLRNSLHQGANQLFKVALSTDFDQVSNVLASVGEMGELRRGEVEAALKDLEEQKHPLGSVLEANLQFTQGLIALDDLAKTAVETNRSALEYFQKSFEFWQAQSSSPLREESAIDKDNEACSSVLRSGLLSFYIGRCHYFIADEGDLNDDTKLARQYLEQVTFIFDRANRPDLVSYGLPLLGRTIRRTAVECLKGSEHGQAWQDLEVLAKRGIQFNETVSYPWGLVQHYGFLVDIALTHNRWSDAKHYATLALQKFEAVTKDQQWARSLFLWLLAKAEQGLGNPDKAIEHLKVAQKLGVQGHPKIYIRVLNALQEIYFDQGEQSPHNQNYFLDAFLTKLERLSVEQQYGFRAFVGAGRIQPEQRDALTGHPKKQPDTSGEVATEMRVSRWHEIEDLMKRMRQPAYKLVIIHGLSGVGKSSLIDAAFLPTLRNSTSGGQEYLPVLIRRYNNWAKNLADQLCEALESKGIKPITELIGELQEHTIDRGIPSNRLIQSIYRQLQDLDQKIDDYHLQSILIFDQFEEIFVLDLNALNVDAQRNLKQQFFSFLSDCLNLTYLKIVLSLREDYLHFLLEGSRLVHQRSEDSGRIGVLGANIMGDILSQDKLYFIGNFGLDEAANIIRRLTARTGSQLPDDLITRLVDDLAVEMGEVRPIELQVVGSVLQDRNIFTLSDYEQLGERPKEVLVGAFLDQVIEDCGKNNKDTAELILYLLTGDKEMRPRKTLHELTQDPALRASEADRLKLILRILVESRLVLLLPETPEDRYQLVHDYLAALVRSKVDPGKIEVKRKQQEIDFLKLNRRHLTRTVIATSILGTISVLAFLLAFREAKRAIISNVRAAVTQSQFYHDSGNQIEALVTSYKVNRSLQRNSFIKFFMPSEIKLQADGQLLQIFQNLQEIDSLKAHQGFIYDVAVRDDGLVATAGADKVIRLWGPWTQLAERSRSQNSYKSTPSTPLRGRLQTILCPAMARSQSLIEGHLVSFCTDPYVDPEQPSIVSSLVGHNSRVNSISLSAKCNLLASASDDGRIILWDLIRGKSLYEMSETGAVRSISISPDGKWMATGNDDGLVKFWGLSCHDKAHLDSDSTESDLLSNSPSIELLIQLIAEQQNPGQESGNSIRDIQFHPSSDIVAVSSYDNVIRFWNSAYGELISEIRGCVPLQSDSGTSTTCMLGEFSSLSFSFDGSILASGGATNRVYLWKKNGQNYESYLNSNPLDQAGRVADLSFSKTSDKNILTVAVYPNLIRIWNINSDPQGASLENQKINVRNIRAVEFDRNNRLFSGLTNGVLKTWQVEPALQDKAYIIDDFPVKDFSLSVKGRVVAAIEDTEFGQQFSNSDKTPKDATLRVWSLENLDAPTELGTKSVPSSTSNITISPNNRTIVYLVDSESQRNPGKRVLCWDVKDKNQVPQECSSKVFGNVGQIEFSPDGNYLALVELDKNATCIAVQDPKMLRTGELKIGQIHLLPMSHKSADLPDISIVEKCELGKGEEYSSEEIFTAPTIKSIKFHPDSTHLAIGLGKDVKFYNLKKHAFEDSLSRIGHAEVINDLDFSSDGKYLATASNDNTSRALAFRSLFKSRSTDSAQSERSDSSIRGHEGRVERVTFGKGNTNFFTVDTKGIISLWSIGGDPTHPLVKFPLPSFYLDNFNNPQNAVNSAEFSKSEGLFAFIGKGRSIFLWKIDLQDIGQRSCDWHKANRAFSSQGDDSDAYNEMLKPICDF